MNSVYSLLYQIQRGNKDAEAQLINRYEPVIKKYAKQNGVIDEDCKQQLSISFILAARRFDISRYE
ncbi:helix-turn-helix domain-containing protein [Paenibacillus camerounensis]|uniref:helix-turn-helix domain-containing protein n=1 Tax=Paenibacillus camerounensis TaxID=1243663 RepID=UPI0005A647D4|nr:helix-turn-helix domain-containing protein [Paenibacillus camerounensis]